MEAGPPGRARAVEEQALMPAHPAEYPFHQSPMVIRSCASSCIASDPDSIGAAHPVYCCFRDLCNSIQATRVGVRAQAPLGAPLLP